MPSRPSIWLVLEQAEAEARGVSREELREAAIERHRRAMERAGYAERKSDGQA